MYARCVTGRGGLERPSVDFVSRGNFSATRTTHRTLGRRRCAVAAEEERERGDEGDDKCAGIIRRFSFNRVEQATLLPTLPGSSPPAQRRTSRIVPLLDPLCVGGCSFGVPFVTGIELHDHCGVTTNENSGSSKTTGDADVFELRFVLDGQGILRHHSDKAKDAFLSTGDAILMRHGVATLDGLMANPETNPFYSMATFVTYMPRALVDPLGVRNELLQYFAPFGRKHIWRERGDTFDTGNASNMRMSLSSAMDRDAIDSMLSGAAMWMERNDQTTVASVASVDMWGSDAEKSIDPFYDDCSLLEAVDDVSTFSTPDSTISQSTEVKEVFHKQISASATYVLPNQTNRLALLFDPFADTPVPFVFGVEIFEPGHRTTPHVHEAAYEVFFILSGEGEGFCDSERFEVRSGDVVAFHPGSEHGIDNGMDSKMYCIEVMMPDEEFAEFVRGGRPDGLRRDELCILRRMGCQ